MIELSIKVILVEPEKPGNIGAIARSMKNFELDNLWIVNPKTTINSEAKAFSMRGIDVLASAKIVRTLKEALEKVDLVVGTSSVTARSTSNLSRVSMTPAELAEKIRAFKGRVGILFGRESSGLNNREVEACDFIVTVPASADYNVLNIATAASIVFYETFQTKVPSRSLELAATPAKERLLRQFNQLVTLCDVQQHRRRLAQRAFRNVISRSFISRREASLLLGVFRKASSSSCKLK